MSESSYLTAFNFNVNFSSSSNTSEGEDVPCQEVSGFSAEIPTEDLAEGGELSFVYKLPKTVKYKNLVMKRAVVSGSSTLKKWVEDAVQNFSFEKKMVTVSLRNENHEAVKTWCYYDVYPVKCSYGDMNSTSNQIVIETLEMAYRFAKEVEVDSKK